MLTCHVHKRLREFSVSLALELGNEPLVLIGNSGCGKTTLLRMLAGLSQPDRGRIELNSRVLVDTDGGVRPVLPEHRQLGYVVQNYCLFPHLSVRGNVGYGLRHLDRTERARRTDEALELGGLAHLSAVFPGHLSGGEQQRVAVARALARRPHLLLLDEPLSALDVSLRSRLRGELKSLLATFGIPAVVVTHDYEDARSLGQRIAVMERGEIVQEGTADELARRPANAFVAAFTGTNLVDGLAFDPWRVRLSSASTSATHEWQGRVADVARLGSFSRLAIVGERGGALAADAMAADASTPVPALGETVWASVAAEDVRRVAAAVPVPGATAPTPAVEPAGPRRSHTGRGWRQRGGFAVIGLALGGSLLATAGFRSGSASAVPPGRVPLEVSAAANLARVLPALAARYDQRHGRVSLLANYAGTQILLTQLEQGQSSDLFFSADLAHMRQAQREGIVRHYSVVSELSPVIIVPRSNPAGIRSLQDLGTRPVQLVIGVPTVPVGAYARTIFRNANAGYGANFYAQALSHVVSTETNTGEVTQQVASGQADAGVVYRSDIGPSIAARVSIIPIPPAYEVVAANYGAVVTHARHADQAQAFLAFITSPAGQELQRGFGYLPLAGATAAASLGAAGPTAALERRT